MAEPFVFHFSRGTDGQPQQMYLADVRAECTLCGHPQLQRYYHAAPLHSISTAKLVALASAVPQKTEYECPNCGTAVGPDGCLGAAFTWAFPDDAGLVRAFVELAGKGAWQLLPRRRLDPQELPGWAPDPELEGAILDGLDAIDDEWIEETLLRPVNPKLVIREVLQDWLADPEGGAVAPVTPGMTLLAAGPETDLAELRGELESIASAVAICLDDCVPHDLPTHREPAKMAGHLSSWLDAEVDRSRVELLVEPEAALAAVQRAFEVGNLTFELRGEGAHATFEDIRTPREAAYPRSLPVLAILRRAVYTGLTPGDAARLTAEEIVGTLLRVW